jgi:EAL domain-containing protein (putative c-di-GMP-specific phosphodiesterase class I)
LTIEILEGISLQEGLLLIQRLNAIKALGCRLAIDDFGTEGSNFSRLMSLDVDYIKIDGSFIKNLDRDERSRKITRAIVAFAKSIGCKTIAEYVHSEAVWKEVCSLGIDFSQGYWLGAPGPDFE